MTSLQSTEKNTSYSSKNWLGWCWNNWRKGKPSEDVKQFEIRDFSFRASLLFCVFFRPSFTESFIPPDPHLIPSLTLLPLHHFPPNLQSPWGPLKPLLSFVCGLGGWIRMSNRKHSQFLTSPFPLPCAHFLQLRLTLRPVLNQVRPLPHIAWRVRPRSGDVSKTRILWLRSVYFHHITMKNHVYSFQCWEKGWFHKVNIRLHETCVLPILKTNKIMCF